MCITSDPSGHDKVYEIKVCGKKVKVGMVPGCKPITQNNCEVQAKLGWRAMPGPVPTRPVRSTTRWTIPFTKSTSHKHCVSSSFFSSWAAATANWLRARLVPVSATLQGELQHSSWTSNHCDAPTFLQIMSEREWNYANRNEDSLKSKQSKTLNCQGQQWLSC